MPITSSTRSYTGHANVWKQCQAARLARPTRDPIMTLLQHRQRGQSMPRCSQSITGASKKPAHLAPAAPVACRVSSFPAMPAAMASRTRSPPAGPAATLACAASVVPAPKIVHAAPGAPSPAAELTCPAPAGPEGRCARGRPAPAVPAAILVCPAPNNGCIVHSHRPPNLHRRTATAVPAASKTRRAPSTPAPAARPCLPSFRSAGSQRSNSTSSSPAAVVPEANWRFQAPAP